MHQRTHRWSFLAQIIKPAVEARFVFEVDLMADHTLVAQGPDFVMLGAIGDVQLAAQSLKGARAMQTHPTRAASDDDHRFLKIYHSACLSSGPRFAGRSKD